MKEKILICFFLIAVFINFLGPIVDPDFPFHLKTGEYIYKHKELPEDDPFSFYGQGIITEREKFILSQYWITQVIFYEIYSLMGPTGIILLRAAVFFTFVFLLWLTLRKRGFYSSLVITVLIILILQASKVDRPQFFSFLFTLVLILLIERFRGKPDSPIPLFFIPPMMLFWANMHGGFVFGIAIILISTLSEALKYFVNKPNLIGQPLKKKAALIFFVVALLAISFSYINPNTNGALLITLESHANTRWLYEVNREYISPAQEMSVYYGIRTSVIAFFFILGFVSIVTCLHMARTKSVDITIFALIFFSAVAAFTAVRYIPFFIAVALPLSKGYRFLNDKNFLRGLRKSSIVFVLFLIFFVLAVGFGLKDRNNMFKIGHPLHYPGGAANFLLSNRVGGNIFNQHNKGSYLIWKLYPYYKVFNDTRFISLEAVYDTDAIAYTLEDYRQPLNLSLANALSALVPEELGKISIASINFVDKLKDNKPLWKRLLDRYKIDFIVHEACADYTWGIYPLTLRLLKEDEWVLVYYDGTMQIFVRNKEKYSKVIKKFKLPKELIYDEIILETTPVVRQKVPIAAPYSSLAFALMMKEDYEDAKKMIDAALELDKKDLMAHFCNAYLALKQKAGEKPI